MRNVFVYREIWFSTYNWFTWSAAERLACESGRDDGRKQHERASHNLEKYVIFDPLLGADYILLNLSCQDPNPDGTGSLVPSQAWQRYGRLLGLARLKLPEHLGQLDARDADEEERCQDRDDCQYLHL